MTRKALISGGSGGIGSAVAERLAAAGMHVWIHYHSNPDGAHQTAERITAQGGRATTIGFDITDSGRCRQAMETLLEDETVIDVVVHSAGITADAPFPGMDEAQWRSVIDTSLHGFFHITRPLIMAMIRQRWGRIVSVSSIAALHGNRGQSNYAAAKAGLVGFTKSLAREVGSRGITVNAVAPGFIDTDMTRALAEAQKEALLKDIPLGRLGQASEIAAAVAFLASPGAGYISGETLHVNGGMYMA